MLSENKMRCRLCGCASRQHVCLSYMCFSMHAFCEYNCVTSVSMCVYPKKNALNIVCLVCVYVCVCVFRSIEESTVLNVRSAGLQLAQHCPLAECVCLLCVFRDGQREAEILCNCVISAQNASFFCCVYEWNCVYCCRVPRALSHCLSNPLLCSQRLMTLRWNV